ncbi:hypothetical protein ABR737_00875 [Streptomyces sp. Edi2]
MTRAVTTPLLIGAFTVRVLVAPRGNPCNGIHGRELKPPDP